MQLSRATAISCFLLLAGFWYALFVTDAGNFWHGGSALGLVVMEGTAALGTLAFVEVMRSGAHKVVKIAFGVATLPLALFVGSGLFYAAKSLFSV